MTVNSLTGISGIGPQTAKLLFGSGFKTVASVANASIDELSKVQGFSTIRAVKTIELATSLLSGTSASTSKPAKNSDNPQTKPVKEAKKDMASKRKDKIKKLKKQLNKKKLKKKDKKKLKKKLKKLKK